MNTKTLAELIDQWDLYCTNQKGESLHDFAIWLLNNDYKEDDEIETEEDLKFKLLELSRFLEIQAKFLFKGDASELQLVRVLSIIEKHKHTIKQSIVQESLLEPSTGFYIIKLLADRGMVKEEKYKKDKRAITVTVTAKGRAYLQSKQKDLKKLTLLPAIRAFSEKKSFIKVLNLAHKYNKDKTQL